MKKKAEKLTVNRRRGISMAKRDARAVTASAILEKPKQAG